MIDLGIKEYTVEYLEQLISDGILVRVSGDSYHGCTKLFLSDGTVEEVYDGVVGVLYDYLAWRHVANPESSQIISFDGFQRWKAENDDLGWFFLPVDNDWVEKFEGLYGWVLGEKLGERRET